MKYKLIILVFFNLILKNISLAQQEKVDSLIQLGNEFFGNEKFLEAATNWEQGAELAEYNVSKREYYVYTSMAFAKAMDSFNSFRCLEKAIKQYGYNDLPAINDEASFSFMKKSNRWNEALKSIKIPYSTNPKKVNIIDSDVVNYWKAYDLTLKGIKNSIKIYREEYISKGTIAMQDYYVNKIDNLDNFIYHHNLKKKFYESIRQNSLNTKTYKTLYRKYFKNLKRIYPEAIFPPIYFVIGKFNSAGTVSSDGLIIAIDQACMTPQTDTSELTLWEKNNLSNFDELPYTVAHELIHYEQGSMASSKTLLRSAIREGMADFICKLITGKTANEKLFVYAKGKEKTIWEAFKKEMLLNDKSNWIANSDQETVEKPADLGYWVGYQICKAYYDEMKDKKQAIFDMLHIQDYALFLEQSKLETKIYDKVFIGY